MTPEEIFHAARARPPAERSVYLTEACAGDAVLQRRVEALLQAHANPESFLVQQPSILESTIEQLPTERPGRLVGAYRLLEQIGEGGFGVVFMAEQTQPIRRRVALKILKPGMDSRQIVARFEAERQALAIMDHPNIAKVHDGGATPSGRPYFVMELVKGVPITQFCDQNHLTPRQRLELFTAVCQAVQHAHQKGIIHRDLKPSNVLVVMHDTTPVPKVIDFGIAKALGQELTDKTLFTGFAQMVGTPQYMSPEQAGESGLDVDTRSDIYSLGVLLYELLTGTTPFTKERFKKAAYDEIRRIIREEDPPRPSTRLSESKDALPSISAQRQTPPAKLTKLMRGELDWIVMKSLEKDRNRRYETANGFAADVRRYLNDEPVSAGPPSASYRLRKYARKHFKVLATAAAFLGLLVAATVTSAILASWALRERNHAQRQKQSAEANLNKALEAVDQMLTRVGEAQLLNVPQMEPVRRKLLQDAVQFYQEFLKEKGDRPIVRLEAAGAYRRIGTTQFLLGHLKEAEEALRQSIALTEGLFAESPDDPAIIDKLANIHNDLGMFYQATARASLAEKHLTQSVTLREPLVRRQPEYTKSRLSLAGGYANLVMLYRSLGRLDQAEAAFQRCMALLEDLLVGDANNVECLRTLAAGYQNVALVYGARDRFADAEAAHEKAEKLYERLIRAEPDVVNYQKQLAAVYNNLGILHSNHRNHAKAEVAYRQSLAMHEAILRDHPKVVSFQIDVGACCSNMATHVRRSRSPEESLPWSARAIDSVRPVLEREPQNLNARGCLFDAHYGRANALQDLDRREEAAKDWKRVIELSEGQSNITMRLFRPSPLAHLREHGEAAREMETLLTEGKVQPANFYIFAYVYARCAGVVAADSQLAQLEREKLADKYGSRAIELLINAQNSGYFNDPGRLTRMRENKDFDSIRSRPDFEKLSAELEQKVKK